MVSYYTIWYYILHYLIIFYTIQYNFTDKYIKCTFWPGMLPLQGTPTGNNNVFFYYILHDFT